MDTLIDSKDLNISVHTGTTFSIIYHYQKWICLAILFLMSSQDTATKGMDWKKHGENDSDNTKKHIYAVRVDLANDN